MITDRAQRWRNRLAMFKKVASEPIEAGDVFEVQTDAGLYELVGGEWVFKPWERMESET